MKFHIVADIGEWTFLYYDKVFNLLAEGGDIEELNTLYKYFIM